jgi:diguanylate cyclase (GGDEF)-like protein
MKRQGKSIHVNPANRSMRGVLQFPRVPDVELQPLRRSELLQTIEDEVHERTRLFREQDDHEQVPGIILRMMLRKYASALQTTELSLARRYIGRLEEDVGEDSLTGLPNRRQYNRHMDNRFAAIRHQEAEGKTPQPLSLAVIDIDHFKGVNTTGGHPGGDLVLRCLAKRVRRSAGRASDALHRFGGEEFVLVMPETGSTQAAIVMERLREDISQNLLADVLAEMSPGTHRDAMAALGSITVSIGVSAYTGQKTPQELFTESDDAMYAAKKGLRNSGSGRNRIEVFSPELRGIQRQESTAPQLLNADHPVDALRALRKPFEKTSKPPADIFTEYAKNSEPWNRVNRQGRRSRFPLNPLEGLEYLFSQPALREQMLAEEHDSTDIQNLDAAMRHLHETAMIDELTQIPNRKMYERHITSELAESTRDGMPRGLIVFDVDHFKKINDTLGHEVGDLGLYAFGYVLQQIVQPPEVVARIGGEEFAIVTQVESVDQLKVIAERYRSDIARMVMPVFHDLLRRRGIHRILDRDFFSVSMGGTISVPEDAGLSSRGTQMYRVASPERLYHQADIAAYIAKGDISFDFNPGQTNNPIGSGRNRWVMHDPRMDGVMKL